MIITKLQGGLGNQMFQYAIGRNISIRNETILKVDKRFLEKTLPNIVKRNYELDIFKLNLETASDRDLEKFKEKNFYLIKNKSYIKETSSEFNPKIFNPKKDLYLDGYWQSYKYFDDIKNIISEDFSFKDKPSKKVEDLLKEIDNKQSVCINIRRQDFVHHPINKEVHGFCDSNYFDEAIKIIKNKVTNPFMLIFSDDLNWCRSNILNKHKAFLVDHSFAGNRFQFYLMLMMRCKNQIIPNSSFGWWAAYLNTNKNKLVIAPRKWIKKEEKTMDRYPSDWIVI